jgi:hypothetical protein
MLEVVIKPYIHREVYVFLRIFYSEVVVSLIRSQNRVSEYGFVLLHIIIV